LAAASDSHRPADSDVSRTTFLASREGVPLTSISSSDDPTAILPRPFAAGLAVAFFWGAAPFLTAAGFFAASTNHGSSQRCSRDAKSSLVLGMQVMEDASMIHPTLYLTFPNKRQTREQVTHAMQDTGVLGRSNPRDVSEPRRLLIDGGDLGWASGV